MPRKVRTLLLALVVVVFAVALPTALFLCFGRMPPPSPLPTPPGYADFLKAAAVSTGDVGNAATLDHDGLRALVSTNAESLRLLRLGLTRQCALPADFSMTNVPGMLNDLAAMKRLGQLLVAEGRLAEMESRYGEAAHSYLDAIRLGNEMSRGGFIINRLVGIACEAIGDTPLGKLVPRLTPEEDRQIIVELEKIDSTTVTWDEVLRNETRFAHYQPFNPITWVMTRLEVWRARQRAEVRNKRIIAHLRLLTAELAVRCYQSEKGNLPTNLEQLVPRYLQRIPLDPFSNRPLIYRPHGTPWLLYSVGEDGVDDGGKPVTRSASGTVPKGDIFYDSPY